MRFIERHGRGEGFRLEVSGSEDGFSFLRVGTTCLRRGFGRQAKGTKSTKVYLIFPYKTKIFQE
ncbi:MAG: hypothetical protein B0D92_08560 [Spirochaeta sp. LUC14_002_19_P3]|nr:MAG: hypothetical protein B0D92_08560 [Spirochaeta sp. LUC14_002_19_P3]